MGTYKAEVFLSSRFEDFAALRALLCRQIAQSKYMSPIDLGDGHARHRPPLSECLARVRRAEIMLLLVGDTYGKLAPGKEKSFTHLEYDEAVRDGSRTRVLVYLIRSATRGASTGARVPEPWLKKLAEKHTIAHLDPDEDPEKLASEAMKQLHACLYDLRFGEVSEEDDGANTDIGEPSEDEFDDSEVDSLEAMEARARGTEVLESLDDVDAVHGIGGPAALAAREQRGEAERAIALREFGLAIQHARRALELRPLDGTANLLLARLYVATGRRDRFHDAAQLAERAARISSDAQLPYRASAAYLLAARAETELQDLEVAHEYVGAALELQPNFARAHIERARIYCRENDSSRAIASVGAALQVHTASLLAALRDPHLRPIRSALRQLMQNEVQRWRAEVERLLGVERQLLVSAGGEEPPVLPTLASSDGLQRLRRLGRESIARQRDLVAEVVAQAEGAHLAALPEGSSPAARLSLGISELETRVTKARAAADLAARELDGARALPSLWNWESVLPPTASVGLALFSGSIWVGAMIIGLGIGIGALLLSTSYKVLEHARARRSDADSRYTRAADAITVLESQLESSRCQLRDLQRCSDEAKERVRAALSLFEQEALSMPTRYQPFAGLRSARSGSLVRMSGSGAHQFQERYRRRVECDERGFWSDREPEGSGFALYRVISSAREVIRLSRRRAYESGRTELIPALAQQAHSNVAQRPRSAEPDRISGAATARAGSRAGSGG